MTEPRQQGEARDFALRAAWRIRHLHRDSPRLTWPQDSVQCLIFLPPAASGLNPQRPELIGSLINEPQRVTLDKMGSIAEAKASPPQKIDMDTIGRSRWYWDASAENFRRTESTAILGQLVVHHPFDVGSKQRDAWLHQIEALKLLASAVSRSHFFLEFSIPRMGKRSDAILLAGGMVFVMEYKVGASEYWGHAADQAWTMRSISKTSIPEVITARLFQF